MPAALTSLANVIRSVPRKWGRPESRSYIPELDGLRCLAVTFVLVWHAALRASRHIDHLNQAGTPIDNYYDRFPHGEVGVILFFFISGFVVSQPFLLQPRENWRIGRFYKRRFIRIYPPYLIAMLLCFFALAIVGHVPTDAAAFRQSVPLTRSLLASLVYMHGLIFNGPSRLNPPLWSLEIEILFYAVLPPLMALYCLGKPRGPRLIVMSAVIIAVISVSSLLITSTGIDLRFRWGLFYHSYLFLVGILMADVFGDPAKRHVRRHTKYDLLFVGGMAAILYVGYNMTQNDARMTGQVYAFEMQDLTIGAILCIFYGAFLGRWASYLLCLTWVRLIGTMCYSIYLTHIVIMSAAGEVLERIFPSRDANLIYAIYLLVLIGSAMIAASIFYIFIERPFAQGVGILTRAPRAQTVEPLATADSHQ